MNRLKLLSALLLALVVTAACATKPQDTPDQAAGGDAAAPADPASPAADAPAEAPAADAPAEEPPAPALKAVM